MIAKQHRPRPRPVRRRVTPDEISRMYDAAAAVNAPKIPDAASTAWWQDLLVMMWNTAIRPRSLLRLHTSRIDLERRRLVLDPREEKFGVRQVIPLNTTAVACLRRIDLDRELVFGEPNPLVFYRGFRRLQDLAGIPASDRFGVFAVRCTVISMLYKISPAAALYALGLSSPRDNHRFYFDAILARALDQIPQPEAFSSWEGGAS